MQTVRTFRKLRGGRARGGRGTVLHTKLINTHRQREDGAGGGGAWVLTRGCPGRVNLQSQDWVWVAAPGQRD